MPACTAAAPSGKPAGLERVHRLCVSAGGWLEIYHGNCHPTRPGEVGVYSAGAMLLDLHDPSVVLRRTHGSIIEPEAEFERHGFVPDVVFPTGIVETSDSYLVYYGAADSGTAVVEFSREDVLGAMV